MPVLYFNANKNVSISSKYTSQSYGGTRLAFGRGSAGDEYQLLIGFEAIALPANSVIDSATLTVPKTTGALGSYAGFTAQAVRLTSAFTTASSWDSGRPSYTTTNAATADTGVDHTGNVVFDVTAMVKDWVGGAAQHGVALRKSTSGGTYIKVAVDNGSYITVTYHLSASTFTTDGSATIGAAEDITISSANSGYTHDLTLTVGGTTYTLATGKTAAALTSFTIPMEACSKITASTSATGTLTLTTKNGGTTVGSPVSKTISVIVPASVVPTISGLTAAVAGNSVAVDGGVFLKDITKVLLTAGTAEGAYGSAIQSYTFSGNGWNDTSTGNTVETPYITAAGNITYSVNVTDSRGRTASASVTITVNYYASPVLAVAQAVRADETGTPSSSGTYILVTAGASVTNVLNNAATITAAVTLQGSTAVLWSGTFTDGSLLLAGGGAAEAKDYAVTITATDSFGKTAVTTLAVLHSGRTINVTEDGSGVAVGGFAENGKFTVWLPAKMPQSRRYYVVSGHLWNSATGDTIMGHGTATVDIAPNGIARIDFSIQVTTAGTNRSQFTHGLNRDLMTDFNGNIPRITPIDGGICTFYNADGTMNLGQMGYGGVMRATQQFWNPARIYQPDGGDIGGWEETQFAVGYRIIGTCYGTVEL